MTVDKKANWKAFVFTLLGIILGAGFQYMSNVNLEKVKHLELSKKDAYIDFLNAQQKYYASKKIENKSKAKEILYQYEIEIAAATKRIAIYGGKQVAEALAKFYVTKLEKCSNDNIESDVAIYSAMRAELLPENEKIGNDILTILLFSCKY